MRYSIPENAISFSSRGMINVEDKIVFTSYDKAAEIWMFDTVTSKFEVAKTVYNIEYCANTQTTVASFNNKLFAMS